MANTHSLDLEFSSSQYAYVADNADVSVTGDITMEAWINLETKDIFQYIAGKWLGTTTYSYVFDIENANNYLEFRVSDDGTTDDTHFQVWRSTTKIDTTSLWYHVATNFDISGETSNFIINGSEEAGTKTTGSTLGASIYDSNSDFSIGSVNGAGTGYSNFLDGKIDEVRLWDDVRNEAEIDDNKCIELAGNEANLVGYWKFNEDATDSCKSSDLTLVGSPSYSVDYPTCFDVAAAGNVLMFGGGLVVG